MPMIVADNLVKIFPTPNGHDKRAVDGLTFGVEPGTIYGLLGPNGAGKTTTLRMLSGLMTPTAGRALMNGIDVARDPFGVKHEIGFLTANTGLYQRLSSRELLLYFADLYGMERAHAHARVEHLLYLLDMRPFADLRCGALSTGQKQRTSIARALVGDPRILIMDEPTLGLDVLSNRIILDFVRRERAQGKTILLSTHYLNEAEDLCDHVGLLYNGRLLAEGTLPELREQTGEARLSQIFLQLFTQAGGNGMDHGEADDHHAGDARHPIPASGSPIPAPGKPTLAPGTPIPASGDSIRAPGASPATTPPRMPAKSPPAPAAKDDSTDQNHGAI